MFNFKNKILLGSASPRRQLLLRELGLDYNILISEADEIPLLTLKGGEIAAYLSEEKAKVLKSKLKKDEILITADTIVWHDSKMLGKPLNADDAFDMLSVLSGQKHQVYTAVTLTNHLTTKTFCVESTVIFNKINENEIREYIKIYKPFDKAGSYGAQECLPNGINPCSEKEKLFLIKHGLELLFERTKIQVTNKNIPTIKKIEGSYFNVMGLPVVELIEELNLFDKGY